MVNTWKLNYSYCNFTHLNRNGYQMRISLSSLDLQGRKQELLHIRRIRNLDQNHDPNLSTYCSKIPLSQRLVLGLQRNSANSAMWSEDHSGEGRAVSFLKLFSSKSSNKDSTVNVSAKTADQFIISLSLVMFQWEASKQIQWVANIYLNRICNRGYQ